MMQLSRRTVFAVAAGGLAAVVGAFARRPKVPSQQALALLYADPPMPPSGPLSVFHLGHSLVGHDMPAMLAQLAGDGHQYHSQLGWGASLKDHWDPDIAVNGFDEMNNTPAHRPARKALATTDYDAFVMTEMVEIKDAIKWHGSAEHLALWSELALGTRPGRRLYLYETWHPLDDPDGWLTRLDRDLEKYWQDKVLYPALSKLDVEHPIFVIPVGQVFAAVVRAVEAQGGVGPLQSRNDLFARDEMGQQDQIHMSDLGAYLAALTHYAVLYQRAPVGAATELLRADGTPAQSPGPEAALLMQNVVWDIVTQMPMTGVTG